MRNNIFTVKMTAEYYKQKGAEDFVICLGNPLTGYINYELDISIEELYDLEIGKYQAEMKKNKDGKPTMVITLIPPQLKDICPDYRSHIKETYFESDNCKQYTMFDSTKTAINNPPIGYCHNNIHSGYMTRKMMEQHGCLCKNGQPCPYLEKFLTHMYWTQKALNKARKKRKYE